MYWLYKGKQAPVLKMLTNQKAGKKNYKSTTKACIGGKEVRAMYLIQFSLILRIEKYV